MGKLLFYKNYDKLSNKIWKNATQGKSHALQSVIVIQVAIKCLQELLV